MDESKTGDLFDASPEESTTNLDPNEERERALAGTPEQRAQFTLDVPIAFEEYRKANLYIDALLMRAKTTKRPGGLWIVGDGGRGKTFIIQRLLKRLKPREDTYCRHCPVLYLHFEARPSQGEIYTRLLLQLGQDPRSLRSMSIQDLKETLRKAIKTAGVHLIAFDEANHLWVMSAKKHSGSAGGSIGAAIKVLYDDLGVAFVFLGTSSLEDVLQMDSQTTRWPGIIRLPPFLFDNRFLALLATLDECLPMPKQAGLASENLAKAIFESCKANFRLLKMLLAEAVREASREGAEMLTFQHFAKAHFLVHCSEETPFGSI